jgi:hypothetical protein
MSSSLSSISSPNGNVIGSITGVVFGADKGSGDAGTGNVNGRLGRSAGRAVPESSMRNELEKNVRVLR